MRWLVITLTGALVLFGGLIFRPDAPSSVSAEPAQPATEVPTATEPDRSPFDLILTPDQQRLVTANRTSGTVSLLDLKTRQVLAEQAVGVEPVALAITSDGQTVWVSNHGSGTVQPVTLTDTGLTPGEPIFVGSQTHGLALSPDQKHLYVALTAEDRVAIVELSSRQVVGSMKTGRWPRFLALSDDGTRLAVGTSGDRGVTLLDVPARKVLTIQRFVGLNIGQMDISKDQQVYFPWMVYRMNPISGSNIQKGWVMASRVARLAMDGKSRREAMSLDPSGKAVSDPHGLALTPDEQLLAVTAGGTQELLLFKLPDLPLEDSGSSDHIPPELLNAPDRFTRIPLGGRPLSLRIADDNRTAYVANYLLNSVQVVDLQEKRLVGSISLGGPETPSAARRGEAIFYDARHSLDQWYSCHSCHYEGGTNSVTIDTFNDGTAFTFKTVLPLYHLNETPPWTWHGWQEDLDGAMVKSVTSTMLGKEPTSEQVNDLIAYFRELTPTPRQTAPRTDAEAQAIARGKAVFESESANCSSCHSGKLLTDGQNHDVGLGTRGDRYSGFNTPTLLGVSQKILFLHDGQAKSLEDLLTGPHNPQQVSGTQPLSEPNLTDLIAYLKSL